MPQDIFDNNGLPLLAFRKNISFFAIDMDRLALDDPAMTAEIGREVGHHFMEGHYHRLPVEVRRVALRCLNCLSLWPWLDRSTWLSVLLTVDGPTGLLTDLPTHSTPPP